MNKEVTISINNWGKYNPRKDLKTLSWLRLDSDIGFSESLFGLSAEAKWLWVFLLSYSAKKNSASLPIDLEYISYHSSIKRGDILKHIESFVAKGLIELNQLVHESDRIRSNPIENVSYERTNEQTNITTESDLAIGCADDDSCSPNFYEKADRIAEMWNDMATQFDLPKVKLPLSKDRLKRLREPLKEFPDAKDWVDIIFTVPDNDFNLGVNDRKWKANFDWLFHTTKFNYRKLWEARIVTNN